MSNQPKEETWLFDWLRNGSFHAWFSWIEWRGRTAALIAAAVKAEGRLLLALPIGALAFLSACLVLTYGIASFTKFLGARLDRLGPPPFLRRVFAVAVSGIVTLGVLSSFVSVLFALL